MSTVKQLLEKKGSALFSVTPSTDMKQALKLMADKNIGALVVLENAKIVGIFSERDIARKLSKDGDCVMNHTVSEFMSTGITSVSGSNSIFECMTLMSDKRIRHLPVIDNGELMGMITIGDVVNAVIHAQSSTIQQLEKYIQGV